MKLKYKGTIDDIHKTLMKHGIHGSWQREPHDVFMFRENDGANLHWSSRTHSL